MESDELLVVFTYGAILQLFLTSDVNTINEKYQVQNEYLIGSLSYMF